MKVGDIIELSGEQCDHPGSSLLLKIWNFKEYCEEFDNNMLEYDIDEAWEHWEVMGPLLDFVEPETGRIIKIWAGSI